MESYNRAEFVTLYDYFISVYVRVYIKVLRKRETFHPFLHPVTSCDDIVRQTKQSCYTSLLY